MAKKLDTTTAKKLTPDTSKVLQTPVVKKSVLHPDLTVAQVSSFEPDHGDYHLKQLDKDGFEVEGSDISVHPHTFNKAFRHVSCTPDRIEKGKGWVIKKKQ